MTLLTAGDVARYFEVTRDGVRYLARDGQLPFERTLSGQYLFRFKHVQDALVQRRNRKLAPARRIHNPHGQIPLPLARPLPVERPQPLPWRLLKFKPRMIQMGREKAKQSLRDREVKHVATGSKSRRVV